MTNCNLTDCSDATLRKILPGCSRLVDGKRAGVKMAPLVKYEKAIRKMIVKGIIPGFCSLALWRDRVLHCDAAGWADMESKRPFRTDTIVRLYCMTKSVVAVGLMILVERGQCSLDDDVGKFLPCFARTKLRYVLPNGREAPVDRPIILRQLLTHCSGLGYGKELNLEPETLAEVAYRPLVDDVARGKIPDLRTFIERLARIPLRHHPGCKFEYSYGHDVVGRVIEVISGVPLDAFMEREVFEPLSMPDTGFHVRAHAALRLATLYGSFDTRVSLGQERPDADPPAVPHELQPVDSATESAWAAGALSARVLSGGGFIGHNAGGLVTTLNDLARFFLMIARGGQLQRGGPRLLRAETVRAMVAEEWLANPGCLGAPQTNTGLGGVSASGVFGWNALGELGVEEDASKVAPDGFTLHEYGYAGIAGTFWSINPDMELITIWCTQQLDNHSWTTDSANLWRAAREAVAAAARPPSLGRRSSRTAASDAAQDSKARSRSRGRSGRRLSGKQRP